MEKFFTPELIPFTAALALFAGLLVLELALGFLGGSLMGGDSDVELGGELGGDLDADLGADLDADLDISLEADLDADLDAGLDTGLDTEVEADSGLESATGAASWLGLGRVPLLIWVATALVSFGLSGMVLQSVLAQVSGGPIAGWLAALPAGALALLTTRSFSSTLARLVPKAETQSVSERHLGRRRGVVTVGTARRGSPAEVRVTDRYGNTHYLRAEPYSDEAEIPAGTQVVVMRATSEGTYYLVPLA